MQCYRYLVGPFGRGIVHLQGFCLLKTAHMYKIRIHIQLHDTSWFGTSVKYGLCVCVCIELANNRSNVFQLIENWIHKETSIDLGRKYKNMNLISRLMIVSFCMYSVSRIIMA